MGELSGVEGLSFEYILGLVFTPVAFILGVPTEDCQNVGRLIGLKTIINEFKVSKQVTFIHMSFLNYIVNRYLQLFSQLSCLFNIGINRKQGRGLVNLQ